MRSVLNRLRVEYSSTRLSTEGWLSTSEPLSVRALTNLRQSEVMRFPETEIINLVWFHIHDQEGEQSLYPEYVKHKTRSNKSSSSRHSIDEDHGSTTCSHHPAPPPTTTCSLEGARWGGNPVLYLKISAFKDQIYKIPLEIKKTFNAIWGDVLGKDPIEVDHHKSASTRWFCQRATGRSQKRNSMNWCLVLRYIWVFVLASWQPNQPCFLVLVKPTMSRGDLIIVMY